jgi:hypothetical protein
VWPFNLNFAEQNKYNQECDSKRTEQQIKIQQQDVKENKFIQEQLKKHNENSLTRSKEKFKKQLDTLSQLIQDEYNAYKFYLNMIETQNLDQYNQHFDVKNKLIKIGDHHVAFENMLKGIYKLRSHSDFEIHEQNVDNNLSVELSIQFAVNEEINICENVISFFQQEESVGLFQKMCSALCQKNIDIQILFCLMINFDKKCVRDFF